MKEITAFVIFFVVLIASSVLLYHVFITFKQQKEIERLNGICSSMTDYVNSQVTENTSYTSCYCYYEPYAPPKNMSNTQTLCVCDCKLREGGTAKIQVLAPT